METRLAALTLPELKFRPGTEQGVMVGARSLYDALVKPTDVQQRLVRSDSTFGARDAGTNDGQPVLEFIAATEEGHKRDSSILRIAGVRLDNLANNPRFMYAHQYAMLPVGNIVQARAATHSKLGPVLQMGISPLRTEGDDPELRFARLLFRMYANHDIDAVSLGWYVLNARMIVDDEGFFRGYDFLESDALELSACAIPVDPNSLQAAVLRACESAEDRELLIGGLVAGRSNPFAKPGASGRASALYVVRETPDAEAREAWRAAAPAAAEPLVVDWDAAAASLAAPFVPDVLRAAGMDEHDPDDPIRWNRSLPEAFDVAEVDIEPDQLETALMARYIGCPVKRLDRTVHEVESCEMGGFLAGLDDTLSVWDVQDVRNLTRDGKECPPVHAVIQLNSTRRGDFLIEGIRFMQRRNEAGETVRMGLKVQPVWWGLLVITYVEQEQRAEALTTIDLSWERSKALAFLRGEAFSLSGEFIERGELSWDDVFLTADVAGPLQRVQKLINEQGVAMANRGVLLMGPPGTGKTVSGRVLLSTARSTFIWITPRDFYRMGTIGGLTYAFDKARELGPCILFFEDVEGWLHQGALDLLKTEMDGLKRSSGITTILTTNHPEVLPDALIDRPGRFHDVLRVSLPDAAQRSCMLARWLPTLPEDERPAVVEATEGYSGAHMRELATFAEAIGAEEGLDVGAAVQRALAKIREQRELIAAVKGYTLRSLGTVMVRGTLARKKEQPLTSAATLDPAQRDRLTIESLQQQVRALQDALTQAHVHQRAGKVLSRANRSKIEDAVTALRSAANALEEVLASADRTAEDASAAEPAPAPAPDEVQGAGLEALARDLESMSQRSTIGQILSGLEGIQASLSGAQPTATDA